MLDKFTRRHISHLSESANSGRFSTLQRIAAAILLTLTIAFGLQVVLLARQPETTLRSITDSDDATGNAFFTQRETLVLAIKFERWLSGNEGKSAVLVRRALLGQRLNVKDKEGVANGERASTAYMQSLENIDDCLARSPDGVLSVFNQSVIRQTCGDAIELLIFEARQLGVDISGAGDVRVREIIRLDREERNTQTLRLWLIVILLFAVSGFLGISRTKSLQRLRGILEKDQEDLRDAQSSFLNIEAELDDRILSENQRRSEEQRLDLAVRTLTTEIRMSTSVRAAAENLVNGVCNFLQLDLAFVHLFKLADEPDFMYIIQDGKAAKLDPSALGFDRNLSSEISHLAQLTWQQAEIRPISILQFRDRMSSTLNAKLKQLRIDENSSMVAIGEGQIVLGYLLLHRGSLTTWQVSEISALQNSVSQAANAIGAIHSTSLVRKIGENQQVVTELQQLERLRNEFTANVNHELRTPLTSIIGYLEVITSDQEELPPTTKNYLSTIRRNADRLLELIEKLLVVSRSASESEAKKEEVDFAEIVAQSVQAVKEKDLASTVNITTDISPVRLLMKGDRLRLEQIVVNLVGNAVKYSKNFSSVEVELKLISDETKEIFAAELTIRDSGIGIPADEIPRLFDRFYRASNAEAALIPGTGLGLSIVRQFIDDHNGSITIESVVGVGTAVKVRLPLLIP